MGGEQYRLLDYLTQSILYGITSFTCLCGSGVLSILVYAQRRAITGLEKSQPLTAEELLELFSGKYRKQVASSTQLPDKIMMEGKFLVKGEVSAPRMIPSIDGKSHLVFSRILSEKICMRASESGRGKNIIERRSEPDSIKSLRSFFLSPGEKKKKGGLSVKSQQTEFESSASICVVSNFSTTSTQIESALSNITRVEKHNDQIKPNSTIPLNSMLVIGSVQKQVGIAIGDSLLIYGSVMFDLKSYQLVIDFPDFIAKNKNEISTFLSKNLHLKAIASFFLFSLGIFYAYKTIVSLLKHRKAQLQLKKDLYNKQRYHC